MTDQPTKTKGLGRGLASLLGEDVGDSYSAPTVRPERTLPIEQLRPNPRQPREHFDPEALETLAQSISDRGILQPILVRPVAGTGDTFEIVAGERRWRAAQIAKLHEIPVVVRDLSDTATLEIALIENIQRQDLSPLEEARGYRRLVQEFSYTQEQLAKVIGKSRSHVANMMRLLTLPAEVQDLVQSGDLTAGAARTLVTADDPVATAREIVRRGLNVRASERLSGQEKHRKSAKTPPKDADTRALEDSLAASLGLKVAINHRDQKGGELRISYRTLEQLDDICRRLSQPSDEDAGADFISDRLRQLRAEQETGKRNTH